MEVEPFDGRGYRLGGDGPLTSSSLSTDSNQTTSQFAALSEDPHTQCSFGSAETPLLVNESMEFSAVGTSIDVDTIIDANDSDVSQDGDTEASEDNILEILQESRMSRSPGCFDRNNTRTPQRLSSKSTTLWWGRRCFCLFAKVSRSFPRKLPHPVSSTSF